MWEIEEYATQTLKSVVRNIVKVARKHSTHPTTMARPNCTHRPRTTSGTPNLRYTPPKIDEEEALTSTWALGSHWCNPQIGNLDAKARQPKPKPPTMA